METVYDDFAKQMLSRKDILSTIMEACIPEYKGLPRETIMACIEEGDSTVPQIHGSNVEDSRMSDAEIKMDILFTSRLPDSAERVGLHINLEVQNEDEPGYPLEKRGVYYASRMIADQKGTVFTGSHYEKLEKVYSIWICPKAGRKKQNSICTYTLQEETVQGKYHTEKKNYDLMTLMMLYLGSHYDYEETGKSVLAMLRLLFAETNLETEERRDLLKDQYAIMLTDKEASEMTNFTEEFAKAVVSEVLEKAMSQGLAQGLEQGLAQGLEKGLAQGRMETLVENVQAFMTSGMPFEEVIRILKPDEETVEKLREKLQ